MSTPLICQKMSRYVIRRAQKKRKKWNSKYTLVFMTNAFISNARLKLAKNQANAEQHTEAAVLQFPIIHILHHCYHRKVIGHILKSK